MWGLISREHHEEVIAAKDALIQSLEAQNAVLAERLAEPVAVSVTMPSDFTLLQPALVKRRKPEETAPVSRKDAPEVDWATVDPNNLGLMAQLAAQEYGRMLSPIELGDWMTRVRRQISAAKDQNLKTPQIPSVGFLETKPVPAHVLRAIEEAETA